MNICVFGTTLQAGVLAGLFAEYGHHVYWCPRVGADHQSSVHYQDEDLNQLIQKQIKNFFDGCCFFFIGKQLPVNLFIAERCQAGYISAVMHFLPYAPLCIL